MKFTNDWNSHFLHAIPRIFLQCNNFLITVHQPLHLHCAFARPTFDICRHSGRHARVHYKTEKLLGRFVNCARKNRELRSLLAINADRQNAVFPCFCASFFAPSTTRSTRFSISNHDEMQVTVAAVVVAGSSTGRCNVWGNRRASSLLYQPPWEVISEGFEERWYEPSHQLSFNIV